MYALVVLREPVERYGRKLTGFTNVGVAVVTVHEKQAGYLPGGPGWKVTVPLTNVLFIEWEGTE